MQVKICGITRLEDALAAVDAGADMLGFNFYPASKRYISPADCTDIQNGLAQHGMDVATVGVFVNTDFETIMQTLDHCHLDLAQLSGDEPPDLLARLGEKAFKSIRPQTIAEAFVAVDAYPPRRTPPALLVDAYQPGAYGGTGVVGDWSLACDLALQMPLLLAGGLTPENVAEAVRQVQPWGVDVASGVESAPGIKDAGKMRWFIAAATGG